MLDGVNRKNINWSIIWRTHCYLFYLAWFYEYVQNKCLVLKCVNIRLTNMLNRKETISSTLYHLYTNVQT